MSILSVNFGVTGLTTAGYRLQAADGTMGSLVTAGVAENASSAGVYEADVTVGSAIAIHWYAGADATYLPVAVAALFDALAIRTALGMASADLDTQLDAINSGASGSRNVTLTDRIIR